VEEKMPKFVKLRDLELRCGSPSEGISGVMVSFFKVPYMFRSGSIKKIGSAAGFVPRMSF
jgi:hypothetical protein